jgi:hypothetical protein
MGGVSLILLFSVASLLMVVSKTGAVSISANIHKHLPSLSPGLAGYEQVGDGIFLGGKGVYTITQNTTPATCRGLQMYSEYLPGISPQVLLYDEETGVMGTDFLSDRK